MTEMITLTREAFRSEGATVVKGGAIAHVETPTPAIVMSEARYVDLIRAANKANGDRPLDQMVHIEVLKDWVEFAQTIANWSSETFAVHHEEMKILAMPKWYHDALQVRATSALAAN